MQVFCSTVAQVQCSYVAWLLRCTCSSTTHDAEGGWKDKESIATWNTHWDRSTLVTPTSADAKFRASASEYSGCMILPSNKRIHNTTSLQSFNSTTTHHHIFCGGTLVTQIPSLSWRASSSMGSQVQSWAGEWQLIQVHHSLFCDGIWGVGCCYKCNILQLMGSSWG